MCVINNFIDLNNYDPDISYMNYIILLINNTEIFMEIFKDLIDENKSIDENKINVFNILITIYSLSK
jgi:hypothetical protein